MHLGIIGVRFELPFNIWCNGCGSHVGRGVRYNSEKSQVGKYYTTPIFKFRMKCHLCDNYFEIQTDPQNSDYVVTSGASRKNERWDNVEGETVSLEGKMEKEKLDNDPMFKLEHSIQDEEIGKDETPRIQLLQVYHETSSIH
jgi:coiled-coil domain-containing protein 130